MTKLEYAQYESRVAAFLIAEDIEGLTCCRPCESGFSWGKCDCCKSTLGGDRFQMVGYKVGSLRTSPEYAVCCDCHYYAEYGVLDDETMLDLAAEDLAGEDEWTYQRAMGLR